MLNSAVESDEFNHNYMFHQNNNNNNNSNGKIIPPTWILLDNQSTIDVFSNKISFPIFDRWSEQCLYIAMQDQLKLMW